MTNLNRIRIAVCLTLLFTLFSHPTPVSACSCDLSTSLSDEFARVDAVFSGKVTRLIDNYAPFYATLDRIMKRIGLEPYFFYANGKFWGYSVIFSVTESWKGVTETIVEADTGYGSGDCGYTFVIDKDYLVYANHAYGIPDNYWITSTCSRTAEISRAGEDLAYLNQLPSIPLKTVTRIPWQQIGVILAIAALAWSVRGIMRRRRPS